MTERHYNDDEIAAIFRAATEGSASGLQPDSHTEGLTLRDLQAIGREVDIAPEAITRAAAALERVRVPAAAQTFFGFPIAVERNVALARHLTDAEWEMLVVELRQVFNARGTVRAHGSLREWSNGNLQALLEPTPTGHQLRMRTFKGAARASVATGALSIGMSAVLAVMVAANGTLATVGAGIVAVGTIGVALVANAVFRLPPWARLRREQMDAIAAWVTAATQGDRDLRALPSDQLKTGKADRDGID